MSMLENILEAFSPGGVQGYKGRQADIDAIKQQTRQRAEQADKDTEDFMNTLGASPVHAGMVQRQVFTPAANLGSMTGIPGVDLPNQVPATSGYVVDKANPDQIRTHVDADGNKVQWELPTVDQQRLRQTQMALDQLRNPANREIAQIQQGQEAAGARSAAQATAQGTAAGKTLGEEENRNTLGTPVSDQEQQTYGLPADTRLTPSERVTLAGKVIPVVTRVTGQANVAGMNNDARADRQQASIAARASGVKSTHVTVGQGGTQSLLTVYNNGETEESPMDAAAAVKPGAGGTPTPGQQGVMSRFQQRFQANDAKAHEALQSKEQGLWAQHTALGDVLSTPDGQNFVDPTSKAGKEIQMNYAQRLVMKNRYQAAEDAAKQAQQDAAKIRQKWGWGEFAPGAQQASPGAQQTGPGAGPGVRQSAPVGGAPAQSTPPQSTTQAAAAPVQPAPLPQSAPAAAAPNFPATAGGAGPTTVRPFKIGQTVFGKDWQGSQSERL